jgi:hypothetical protein
VLNTRSSSHRRCPYRLALAASIKASTSGARGPWRTFRACGALAGLARAMRWTGSAHALLPCGFLGERAVRRLWQRLFNLGSRSGYLFKIVAGSRRYPKPSSHPPVRRPASPRRPPLWSLRGELFEQPRQIVQPANDLAHALVFGHFDFPLSPSPHDAARADTLGASAPVESCRQYPTGFLKGYFTTRIRFAGTRPALRGGFCVSGVRFSNAGIMPAEPPASTFI